MKLLFDENLSPKLPRILSADFTDSMHICEYGLKGFPDEDIWEYARKNGFAIVSKDSDFYLSRLLSYSFIVFCLDNVEHLLSHGLETHSLVSKF